MHICHALSMTCYNIQMLLTVFLQASLCGPMETDRGLEMLLKPLACRKLCRYSILALSPVAPYSFGHINSRFNFGGSANSMVWRIEMVEWAQPGLSPTKFKALS